MRLLLLIALFCLPVGHAWAQEPSDVLRRLADEQAQKSSLQKARAESETDLKDALREMKVQLKKDLLRFYSREAHDFWELAEQALDRNEMDAVAISKIKNTLDNLCLEKRFVYIYVFGKYFVGRNKVDAWFSQAPVFRNHSGKIAFFSTYLSLGVLSTVPDSLGPTLGKKVAAAALAVVATSAYVSYFAKSREKPSSYAEQTSALKNALAQNAEEILDLLVSRRFKFLIK